MNSKRNYLTALVLVAIALPLLIFRSHFGSDWGDEGIFVGGAVRVLNGEVIYRDFQHNYPPGRSFLLAALLSLFGNDISVVRGLWTTFHVLAVGLSFLAARRIMSAPFAILAALAVLTNSVFPNKSAELFLAAAILIVLARVLEGRSGDFTAGLWMTVLGHFRHDVAVFGMLLFPVALGLRIWIDQDRKAAFGVALRKRLVRAWPFAAGVLLAALPFILYLIMNGALIIAFRELTLSGFVANQHLSRAFPSLLVEPGLLANLTSMTALYYIPPLTYILCAVIAIRGLIGTEIHRAQSAAVLLAALFGAMLFVQVLPRTDVGHLNKAYLPAHILGVYLVGLSIDRMRRVSGSKRPLMIGAALGASALVASYSIHLGYLRRGSLARLLLDQGAYAEVRFPRGRLRLRRNQARVWREIISTMRPFAGKSQAWLVTYPGGASINFLCDLPNPLRYDTLRPGELAGADRGDLIPNHPDVLTEIEERIETVRPQFLIDIGEDTNDDIRQLMENYAEREGFRVLLGSRIAFYTRDAR